MTALFYHHGHRKNIKQVDTVFAGKFREIYGRTKYAYGHLGHLHSDELISTNLMKVERHETLAGASSYESNGGWISGRSAGNSVRAFGSSYRKQWSRPRRKRQQREHRRPAWLNMKPSRAVAIRESKDDKVDFEGHLSPLALDLLGRYMHKHRILPDGSRRPPDNWQKLPEESFRNRSSAT